MDGIGAMLTERYGPLPAWVWGLIAVGAAYYVIQRRRKAATAAQGTPPGATPTVSSTNVPTSNLTQTAQPMPVQLGDTFVNTAGGQPTVSSTTGIPNTTVIANGGANTAPAGGLSGTGPPAGSPANAGNAATQVGTGGG